MSLPIFKEIRPAYGFDEVSIVPGQVTINPDMASTQMVIGPHIFDIPILASAMDAVVSPAFANLLAKKGGVGVLNLEGLYTRYQNPSSILKSIISSPPDKVTTVFQRIYTEPIQENLIRTCIQELKASGAIAAVSITPQNTKRLGPIAVEAGADILFVQSTVTTARHNSRSYKGLVLPELVAETKIPIVVGNCVGYHTALELMRTGVNGILVGVGPGAACTTREVVGVGVPQVTATIDCAAARDTYFKETGKYVTVITDGGIRTGGDMCKAIVAGADGVMIGTPFAQSIEAPGGGFNWGMASPHPELPRGTCIDVGTTGSLDQLLYGPTSKTNGTQNLIGALKVAMGMCGAFNIKDMHKAEMVIAPSIKTEGKIFQLSRQ